jgi:hypothetical protein
MVLSSHEARADQATPQARQRGLLHSLMCVSDLSVCLSVKMSGRRRLRLHGPRQRRDAEPRALCGRSVAPVRRRDTLPGGLGEALVRRAR